MVQLLMYTVTVTSFKMHLKSQLIMEVQEALLNFSCGKMDSFTLYESLESTIMACAHTHSELWKQLFKLILSALQSKIVITIWCLLKILLAVMASVAHSSTLSTTTKRTSQATCATLKDVLIDVLCASPSKWTCVITAQHMERRGIWVTVRWTHHGYYNISVNLSTWVGS